MRIERIVFHIADNGATGPLFHAELSEPLPTRYQVRDILEDVEPRTHQSPDLFERKMILGDGAYLMGIMNFEVSGIRSPQSKFVTLKPLSISEEEKFNRLTQQHVRWTVDALT
jgi:hypothetical protein